MIALVLAGCTPCTDLTEIDALPGDEQAIALTALQHFDAWTGFQTCLTPNEQAERGSLSRAEVFHDQCVLLDAERSIAAGSPALFDGFGIDSNAFPSLEARVTEDFARACARATDQMPWLNVALEQCGGTASAEDHLLVDVFGGPTTGLPVRRVEDVYLGSIEGDVPAFAGDAVYTRESLDPEPPDFEYRTRLRAYTLPELTPLWTEVVDAPVFPQLIPGVDRVLVIGWDNDVLEADATGLHPLPAVVDAPFDQVFDGAQSEAGWWLDGRSAIYGLDTANGRVEEVAQADLVFSDVQGPVLVRDRTQITQPATGLEITVPAWSGWPRIAGGRIHVQGGTQNALFELSRPLDATGIFELERMYCGNEVYGQPFPQPDVRSDYRIDQQYPEQPGDPRLLLIWERRPQGR